MPVSNSDSERSPQERRPNVKYSDSKNMNRVQIGEAPEQQER